MKTLWIIYIAFVCLLVLGALIAFSGAASAIQETAVASFVLAGAVVPFLIVRACGEIAHLKTAEETTARAAQASSPAPEAEGVDMELVRKALTRR